MDGSPASHRDSGKHTNSADAVNQAASSSATSADLLSPNVNLLGPYGSSAGSLSSAFPLLNPQSLFPGNFFPFGPAAAAAALGPQSLTDVGQGVMANMPGNYAGGSDWWRMAAEHAKLLADYTMAAGNGFGPQGFGANPLMNQLFGPQFSPYLSGAQGDAVGSAPGSRASPTPSSSHRSRSPASRSTPSTKEMPCPTKSPGSRGTPSSIKSSSLRTTPTRAKSPELRGGRTAQVKSPGSHGLPNAVKSTDLPGGSCEGRTSHNETGRYDAGTGDDRRLSRSSSSHLEKQSSGTSCRSPASTQMTNSKKFTGKGKSSSASTPDIEAKRSKQSTEESESRQCDAKNFPASASALPDYSLRNSLLSAEAAMQSASSLFFPFAMPSPFGMSPFPSSPLFPYMSAAAALGSVYPPMLYGGLEAASGSATSSSSNKSDNVSSRTHHHSTKHASSKSDVPASSASSAQDATRSSSSHRNATNYSASGGGSTNSYRSQHGTDWKDLKGGAGRDGGGGANGSASKNVGSSSSASLGRMSTTSRADMKSGSLPAANSSRETDRLHKSSNSSNASAARPTFNDSPAITRSSASATHHQRHSTTADLSSSSSPFHHHVDDKPLLNYSEDGALDLSVKKSHRSSPASLRSVSNRSSIGAAVPGNKSSSADGGGAKSQSSADAHARSKSSALASSASSSDALKTYSEQAQAQAALMQFLTGQTPRLGDPGSEMSLSLAAAAALLPPVYDSLTGLFYSPSALATMAAASSGNMLGASGPSSSGPSPSIAAQSGDKGADGRCKRKGSSTVSTAGTAYVDGDRNSTSGKSGYSGRHFDGSQSNTLLQAQQRGSPLEFGDKLSRSENAAGRSELSLRRSGDNASDRRMTSLSPSEPLSLASGDGLAAAYSKNSLSRRDTLSSKLLHHQSKLAQSLLTGSDAAGKGHHAKFNSSGSSANGYDVAGDNDDGTDSDDESDDSVDNMDAGGDDLSGGQSGRQVKRKRKRFQGDNQAFKKRRHLTEAELILNVPLEKGWQRDTRVYSWLPQKVVGEVVYSTPCGRKICSIGELKQYLNEHAISELTEENFSFNANVRVGKFCQQVTAKDGTCELIHLTDDEVTDRFHDILLRPMSSQETRRHDVESEQLMQKMVESLIQRKADQQAGLDLSKMSDWQKKDALMKAGQQMSAGGKGPLDLTAPMGQITNDQAAINMHYYTYLLHAAQQQRQREQQQMQSEHHKQALNAMAMDKEQCRQDMFAAKALEARKKEEEKERIKEEKKTARKLEQERRLAQKKYELFLAIERKRPVEDMCLMDSKMLPRLERLPGIRLSSKAFANCLTIVEFVSNYASVLGLDSDSVPSLATVQGGLLHEDGYLKDFIALTTKLVKLAVEDPGIVNSKEGSTLSGQKLVDVNITEKSLSEVLRIFIKGRNGHDDETTKLLAAHPFQTLSPTHKSTILVFICNELLGCKAVSTDIEKSMETIANLRRDKILLEAKLRKLRYQLSRSQRKLSSVVPKVMTPASVVESVPATPLTATPSEDSNIITVTGSGVNAADSAVDDTDSDMKQVGNKGGSADTAEANGTSANGATAANDGSRSPTLATNDAATRSEPSGGSPSKAEASNANNDVVNGPTLRSDATASSTAGKCDTPVGVQGSSTPRSEHASGTPHHDSDTEEDKRASVEELETKIEKLQKQQNQMRHKIQTLQHKLSATCLGQDRYRRRYWVLPKFGGVLVEGIESAEPESVDMEAVETDDIVEIPSEQDGEVADPTHTNHSDVVNGSATNKETEVKTEIESSTDEQKLSNDQSKLESSDGAELAIDVKPELKPDLTTTAESNDDLPAHHCKEELPVDEEVTFRQREEESPIKKSETKSPERKTDPDAVDKTSSDNTGIESAILQSDSESKPVIADDSLMDNTAMEVTCNIKSEVDDAVDGCKTENSPPAEVKVKVEEQDGNVELPEETAEVKTTPSCHVDCNNVPTKDESDKKADLNTAMDTDLEQMAVTDAPSTDEDAMANTPVKSLSTSVAEPATSASLTPTTTAAASAWLSQTSTDAEPSAARLLSLMFQNVAAAGSSSPTAGGKAVAGNSIPAGDVTLATVAVGAAASSAASVAAVEPVDSLNCEKKSSVDNCINLSSVSAPSLANSVAPSATSPCPTAASSAAVTPSTALPTVGPPTQLPMLPMPEPGTHQELDSILSRVSIQTLLTTSVEDLIALSSLDEELPPNYLAVPHNARRIPLDKQRGWWRIHNPDTLKQLKNSLNGRGIRERQLSKALDKHIDYICQLCVKAKKNMQSTDLLESMTDTQQQQQQQQKPSTSITLVDDGTVWSSELQRRIERDVLKEIDNMEERVCNASLQGWKMPPRVTLDESIELVSSDVTNLQPNQQYTIEVAREKLLFLEYNIERRYLKPPLGASNQMKIATLPTPSATTSSSGNTSRDAGTADSSSAEDSDDDSDDEDTPTRELLVWRSAVNSAVSASQLWIYVTQLNQCIAWEKSIMKVTCQICCQDNNEAELLLCDICDRGYHTYCVQPKMECIPEGDWFCYECVAKAAGEAPCCLVCGQRGSRLATCEFCRRRCHIDCMDPPMARLPKRWTCNSCAAEKGKAIRKRIRPSMSASNRDSSDKETTNSESMDGSKSRDGDVMKKEEAGSTAGSSLVEVDCEPPAASELERGPSSLEDTSVVSSQEEDTAAKSAAATAASVLDIENVEMQPPAISDDSYDGEDLSMCRTLLAEMRKQSDAWPFLTPVSLKQFPSYRKYVQNPIDFQTIHRKLKSNSYKSRDEFAADVRLVFINCRLFNDDDSTVGKAGHAMSDYFEARWAEFNNTATPV